MPGAGLDQSTGAVNQTVALLGEALVTSERRRAADQFQLAVAAEELTTVCSVVPLAMWTA